ncbi:hypothetical protein [Bacillus anthracis]|nr:hypothetical protein [Bacillus anthracis]
MLQYAQRGNPFVFLIVILGKKMNKNSLDEIKLIKQKMKEVYLKYKTHMVAMSGGKDSSLVL